MLRLFRFVAITAIVFACAFALFGCDKVGDLFGSIQTEESTDSASASGKFMAEPNGSAQAIGSLGESAKKSGELFEPTAAAGGESFKKSMDFPAPTPAADVVGESRKKSMDVPYTTGDSPDDIDSILGEITGTPM